MFNVEVLDDLPVDHVQINSIWVRGALGDMSIYTTPEGWEGKHERGKEWIKLYVVFEDEHTLSLNVHPITDTPRNTNIVCNDLKN